MPSAEAGILVIDDVQGSRVELGALMRSAGFSVCVMSDGSNALEYAKQRHPALVVARVDMRGMTGYQLCRRFKSSEHLAHVPVVLMSERVGPIDEFWAKRVGAAAVVSTEGGLEQLVTFATGLVADYQLARSNAKQTNR